MKWSSYCIVLLIYVLFTSCNSHRDEAKLVIYTRAPLNSSLYIKLPGYFTEKERIVDSAVVKDNHDSLVFYIPRKQERLYTIILKQNPRLNINFINDAQVIRIHADYFADTSHISGSDASISLKRFNQNQSDIAKDLGKYFTPSGEIKNTGNIFVSKHSVIKAYRLKLAAFFDRYKNYADTVKSAAVFMTVFNNVDYGPDHSGLKKFVLRNAKRFANYQPIQELAKETLATVRIYEQELQIGDKMPVLTLPDKNDQLYSTAVLKGSYYLIDLWSTWCNQCYTFKNAEYHAYKDIPNIKVKMLGIAVDDNVKEWKIAVGKFMHPSVELIDTKMWQGPAVNALLFDSIPYNFLVNPQGKIIAKAIKPDSLAKVIERLVKK